MMTRACFVLLLQSLWPVLGQVGYGTLLQSIDASQPFPANSFVGLQGNPSITTNEVVAWSQADPNFGARALFNAQSLGILFGDRNNDGLPFDWPDIDALEVLTPSTPQVSQPLPFDLEVSFGTNVTNQGGTTLFSTGDIVRLNAIGGATISIPRSAFQAALGTSAALNVDGFARVASGAILVSFVGTGSGTNIISPLSGQPGSNITWDGADVFLIRQPFGSLPALFAYRRSELNIVVSFYYGSINWTEIRGIAVQPNSPGITLPTLTNPWDPTGLYQGGTRPFLLWTIGGDDNVFCWNNSFNPLSTNHNFYAIVGSSSGGSTISVAGYNVTTPSGGPFVARPFIDALALWPATMTQNSRLTLDVSNLLPSGGSNLTLSVRSQEPSGTRFQIAFAGTLGSGTGLNLGASGFRNLILNPNDPALGVSLLPPFSTAFTTNTADSSGTASTVPITVPANLSGIKIYFQGFETQVPFGLTAPTVIRPL